jgi:uncharacterized protein YcfJ
MTRTQRFFLSVYVAFLMLSLAAAVLCGGCAFSARLKCDDPNALADAGGVVGGLLGGPIGEVIGKDAGFITASALGAYAVRQKVKRTAAEAKAPSK